MIADFVNDQPLKRHPDYRAAKAGDTDAAVQVVRDLVNPESLQQARDTFGPDVIYVPVQAEEASGKNKLPNALAMQYAAATGASVAQEITQTNRAFHTGAGAMERLMNRAEFGGEVQAGKRYVLVDDVSTMGSTLADMAAFIQSNGGRVVGSVVMTNAMRSGKIAPSPKTIKQLEARHGEAIREILGIDADQLTGPEAQYLIGFKSTDAIRTRSAKAGHERVTRLDAKKVLSERQVGLTDQSDDEGDALLFSLSVDALAKARAQWSALVDQFVRGGLDESKTYDVLPSSTAVMRMMGLPDLPIRTSTHSLDALYISGIKLSQLKSVLDQLANPQLVMISNRGIRGEMSLNFVTNMENAQGLPLVIALKPKLSARQGRNHWWATITEKQPDSILEMLKSGGGLYVGGGEIAGIKAEDLRAAMRYAKEKQGSEARELVQAIGTNDSLPNLVQRVLYAKDLDKFKSEMHAGDTPMFSRVPSIESENFKRWYGDWQNPEHAQE